MTNLIKTEVKKSVQAGTHRLSNFSKLRVNKVTEHGEIFLSFAIDPMDTGWNMSKESMKELIEVLSEIQEAME